MRIETENQRSKYQKPAGDPAGFSYQESGWQRRLLLFLQDALLQKIQFYE